MDDVERRTPCCNQTGSEESHSSCSSSASFNGSFYETGDEQTLEECEGPQPYFFEPYDSEASSGTDFSNESEEEQFERLQNTDWYVSDQLYLVSQVLFISELPHDCIRVLKICRNKVLCREITFVCISSFYSRVNLN